MLFNSITYLIFLTVVVSVYWLVPARLRLWLVLATERPVMVPRPQAMARPVSWPQAMGRPREESPTAARLVSPPQSVRDLPPERRSSGLPFLTCPPRTP